MRSIAMAMVGVGLIWASGFGIFGYAIYLRIAMSPDPFDPMRSWSVDLMWMSCLIFLSSPAYCAIVSLFVARR
jgi:hypothetical protein